MSNPYKLRFASIRRWPVGEKCWIVEQTLKPGASVARVAMAHGVDANRVFSWRRDRNAFPLLNEFQAIELSINR